MEFQYDRVKPKYGEKAKPCYVNIQKLFHCIPKTGDIYKDIAEDVERGFDTASYELGRPLLKGRNKKVIELMKGELNGRIITKLVRLRAKIYNYLKDDGNKDKKSKRHKTCIIKRKFNFENYKNSSEVAQLENKINHLEKNESHIESIKKDHKE